MIVEQSKTVFAHFFLTWAGKILQEVFNFQDSANVGQSIGLTKDGVWRGQYSDKKRVTNYLQSRKMSQERIALGTVQFGLDYGIANSLGRVTVGEVTQILDIAKSNRIRTLDTAISYGESESILGNYGVSEWELITKIPAIPQTVRDIKDWVIDELKLKKSGSTN